MSEKKTVISISLNREQLETLYELGSSEFHRFYFERPQGMIRFMINSYLPLVKYVDHLRQWLGLKTYESIKTVYLAREYQEDRQREAVEQESKVIQFPAVKE